MSNRPTVAMPITEITKARAWIAAFRARRIDGEGLKRRLLGSGYAERDVLRLTELLAARAG